MADMRGLLFSALLWVLTAPAYGEPLTPCAQSYPGDARPKDWSYRTIDGQKCWYRGEQMRPKHRLYWPMEAPDWMRNNREEPETVLPQEEAVAPWVLEHRWPIYGKGE